MTTLHTLRRRSLAVFTFSTLALTMGATAVFAADAGGPTRAEATGVHDSPDGDSGDSRNDHPSGKDREAEKGRGGTQGRSTAEPDENQAGPERDNEGTGTLTDRDVQGDADKPGQSGGTDNDRDGNNGCGNDDDFDDDNEGWCGANPKRNPDRGTPPGQVGDDDVDQCDATGATTDTTDDCDQVGSVGGDGQCDATGATTDTTDDCDQVGSAGSDRDTTDTVVMDGDSVGSSGGDRQAAAVLGVALQRDVAGAATDADVRSAAAGIRAAGLLPYAGASVLAAGAAALGALGFGGGLLARARRRA